MSTDTPRDAGWQLSAEEVCADLAELAASLTPEHDGYPVLLHAIERLSALSANRVSVPVDYRDPLLMLVEFKKIKRRIEAGTANVYEKKYYEEMKETAWLNAEHALNATAPEPAVERANMPAVLFNDPRVQIVYELLCDGQCPDNSAEHWEGWIARRIVGALSAAPEPAAKMASVPVDQLRIIWDQLAVGRRFLPSHGSFGEQGISAYETAQKIVRAMLSAQPTAEPALSPTIITSISGAIVGTEGYVSGGGSWKTIIVGGTEPAAQAGDGMCGCGDPDCHIAIGKPHTDLAGDHNK